MFSDYKLVTEKIKNEESANSIYRTRANNYLSISAINSYFDSGKLRKAMTGYGLPANIDKPRETYEFYDALKFFRTHEEYFKNNSLTIRRIMDLFSWNQDADIENILKPYFLNKKTKTDMFNTYDVDLRKVAKAFAKNGDYSKGLKSKEELEKIDREIAKYFEDFKVDVINYYNKNKSNNNEFDEK